MKFGDLPKSESPCGRIITVDRAMRATTASASIIPYPMGLESLSFFSVNSNIISSYLFKITLYSFFVNVYSIKFKTKDEKHAIIKYTLD